MSNTDFQLPDAQARSQALDIERSCIVQAPAGSGKTELLTLRYLKLLSVSTEPEQVLAITFTKKAASEMRDRILSTLNWAIEQQSSAGQLEQDFEIQRLAIANNVLERNESLKWNLLANPNRLRVQTIDSFCFYLANQLPVLSRIGGNPTLSEDIDHIYAHAIENTLSKLDSSESISQDIAKLLAHFDNNVSRVEKLLSDLLIKRDQWTSHVLFIQNNYDKVEDYLANNLNELIQESLNSLYEYLLPYEHQLIPLIRFAASNLLASDSNWEELELLEELPPNTEEALHLWQRVAELFLTRTGTWRKQVNVRNGFPAGSKDDKEFTALCKAKKSEFTELLNILSESDDCLAALNYVLKLPQQFSDSEQWEVLTAIANVLMQLNGELLLSFSQFGVMDYTQAGSSARQALGTEEDPTDLSLSLDHKIQHILVDEFQDTSQLQLEILQMLTIAWQRGDGRSLFLVGDAMQSCYSFRNANVGIYLNVQAKGLGEIELDSLILRSNFRSQENVVEWVNKIFSGAFPEKADISRSAVPYSNSSPIHSADENHQIETALIRHDSQTRKEAERLETELVIERIREIQLKDPDASIAILVRYRSHLNQLIPAMKESGIEWKATDIDRLGALPIIEDLLTLTRAITNQADGLAWYALLRVPWCGLTRSDLFAIAQRSEDKSIYQTLNGILDETGSEFSQLSTKGKAYLTPFMEIMNYAVKAHRRVPLRRVVEACWTLLRGFDTAENEDQLASAAHYFELLSAYESNQSMLDMRLFEEQVQASFVSASNEESDNNPVNVLTMHKSKGLEFDHVILPGLSRGKASDDKPMLLWHERLNESAVNRLFLAAQSATGKDEESLYKLIRFEQKEKSSYEDTRLLYIAVTRAKTSAHLFGAVTENSSGELSPASGSLLKRIWPQLNSFDEINSIVDLPEQQKEISPPETQQPNQLINSVTRFNKPLALSHAEQKALTTFESEFELDEATEALENSNTELASDLSHLESDNGQAALIGTLIHRSLETFIKLGSDPTWLERIPQQRHYWAIHLRDHLAMEEIEPVCDQMESTVRATLSNPDFGWLFHAQNSACEVELSITDHNQKASIVDLTLIDKNDVRWIVDFKTGTPNQSQSKEAFIEAMIQRYENQLFRYWRLFKQLEERETKLALLLTGINQLVEVPTH